MTTHIVRFLFGSAVLAALAACTTTQPRAAGEPAAAKTITQ